MKQGLVRVCSRGMCGVAALTVSGLVAGAAAANAAPPAWWEVNQPAALPAAAIGAAARGCLAGAQALPLSGPGYEVMRPSRRRTFGHPQLIAFIEAFAVAMRAQGWPGLLIGDLGQARGGPTSSGHRSHQNGLDVDIWLTPMPAGGISDADREELSAASVVAAGGSNVDPGRWTAAHHALIRSAVSFAAVDRVFVNPAIKQALCDAEGGAAETAGRGWLRKVRPWWGHDSHVHVRLACPEDSRFCEPPPPIPAGDGCGTDLAWWFSAEAAGQAKVPPARPLTLDDLPPTCRAVLVSE